jgi:hypothetical protein
LLVGENETPEGCCQTPQEGEVQLRRIKTCGSTQRRIDPVLPAWAFILEMLQYSPIKPQGHHFLASWRSSGPWRSLNDWLARGGLESGLGLIKGAAAPGCSHRILA